MAELPRITYSLSASASYGWITTENLIFFVSFKEEVEKKYTYFTSKNHKNQQRNYAHEKCVSLETCFIEFYKNPENKFESNRATQFFFFTLNSHFLVLISLKLITMQEKKYIWNYKIKWSCRKIEWDNFN